LEGALSTVLSQGTAGDILEFGIALGGSAIVLAQHAKREGRAFHGFDIFGMIPPPTSEKDDAKSKQRYEVIASGESPGIRGDIYYGYRQDLFDEVRASFARHGVPANDETIVLHKGAFEETWPSYQGNKIAFAHIDCDWYEPVKFCLEHVASRLSPGGVIVVDDYHDYGGSHTATDEFLSARGDFTLKDGANPILMRSSALPECS
jgi:asparagine synthase (glutamine-hydrolysing)